MTPEKEAYAAQAERRAWAFEKFVRQIAYEPIGHAEWTHAQILEWIGNTARTVLNELGRSPERVKHDWTGAMGTVLMEHNGTSFVKWDDGQVTSVYNRHLQKELE